MMDRRRGVDRAPASGSCRDGFSGGRSGRRLTTGGGARFGRGRARPAIHAFFPPVPETLPASFVMPGLVPGIHILLHRGASREGARRRMGELLIGEG